MSFKTPQIPASAAPVAPAIPPAANPPMFGENIPKKKGGGLAQLGQSFGASVLGTLPTGQGQKTLLGS